MPYAGHLLALNIGAAASSNGEYDSRIREPLLLFGDIVYILFYAQLAAFNDIAIPGVVYGKRTGSRL